MKPFNRKIANKIDHPFCAGIFSEEDAKRHRMRLVFSKKNLLKKGISAALYWLVDPADGIIADAKFQLYGPPYGIAMGEIICDSCVGKTYEQAKNISIESLEKKIALPIDEDWLLIIRQFTDLIKENANQCLDIVLQEVPTPVPHPGQTSDSYIYPNWQELPQEQKLAIIEEVIAKEVRPYIEMDEGGIEILQLIDNYELIIAYKGACTSCFSSIGATLTSIQEILRSKIHPEIVVVPNMDDLRL